MLISTKAQISKATLYILCFVTSLVVLGIVVILVCTGLQVNPFKEAMSGFLTGLFGGLIGISLVALILNVATNISLIADAKIAEMKIPADNGRLKKWLIVFVGLAVGLTVFVAASSFISKNAYLKAVRAQADEVLAENSEVVKKVGSLLYEKNGNLRENHEKASDIIKFLSSQRVDLPNITLIYDGSFEGRTALYRLGSYMSTCYTDECKKIPYEQTYYECDQKIDCDYLKGFFAGKPTEVFQKYTRSDNQFYIYVPFVLESGRRFMLLFERQNRYGSVGLNKNYSN